MHDGSVHERLLSLAGTVSSTVKELIDLVNGLLDRTGLDNRDCVSDSFDDAANISG